MKTIDRILLLVTVCMGLSAYTGPLYAENDSQTVNTEITCTAESPIDGSMWMGTSGEGLYRLGKNGSRLHFSASSGKIGSDYIIYVCFDKTGTLWIIDRSGTVTSYTSENGFKNNDLGIGEISKAILLPKEGKLLIAGVTKYYTLNISSLAIENHSEINFTPTELRLSTDSTYVWSFGENKVAKLFPNGVMTEWESNGSVSNSIPLEFETYTDKNKSGLGLGWIILICLSIFVVAIMIGYVIAGRRKTARPIPTDINWHTVEEPAIETQENEPAVHETKPEEPIENPVIKPEPVTKSEPKNAEFTTRVMMLIQEHISEPDFDVESIAALTGMSRIHVNRKLKAEGSPSPSVLIKQRRMDIAKFLLLQSEMPMSQIASECGFRSPSYFTTAFKDYTGLTPSEFVAQNRL